MKSRRDFFVCSRSRLFKFSPWADAGASSGRTHVKPKKQRGLRPANHRDAAAPPSCRGVQPQVRPIRMTMICIGGLRRRTSSLHPYSSRWCPRLHAAFLNVLFAIGAARHCMTSLTDDGHDAFPQTAPARRGPVAEHHVARPSPIGRLIGLATRAQDGSTQRGSSGWGRSARQAWPAKPRVLGHGSKACTAQLGRGGNDGNAQPRPWGTKSQVLSTSGLKMALALRGRACVEAMYGHVLAIALIWHAMGGCRGKAVASGVPFGCVQVNFTQSNAYKVKPPRYCSSCCTRRQRDSRGCAHAAHRTRRRFFVHLKPTARADVKNVARAGRR